MSASPPSSRAPAACTAPGGIRLDPVLVPVVCAVLGAALAVAPAAGLAAFGAGALALARRLGARLLLLSLLGAGLGWARASTALAEHVSSWEDARLFLPSPARCAGEGQIRSSPVQRGPNLRFDAVLTALDCEGQTSPRAWPVRLYVPASAAPPLERGSRVSVVADLAPTSDFRNVGLPDPRPGAARRGAVLSGSAVLVELEHRSASGRAMIDRARAHVRTRILATFAPSVSGLARALVLGESDLDAEDERAFQRSGLSHLLAVSGTHLVLAVLALVRGFEAVAKRAECLSARCDVRRPAALLGLCLAPLYADFAGGSGSAWRAAYMLCAVLGVRAIGRHAFPSRVLALSLAGGWLGDGLVVFDPSFMLSVGATTGLLVFGHSQAELPRASDLTEPRRPDPGRLVGALARAALTTLAATIPCVPLLLSISPGLSLASVAANLLAAPLGEIVALPLCLGHALCWPLPALERGVALVASGALVLIRAIAGATASVEWLYIEIPPPNAWHLAALAATVPLALAPHARPWLGVAPSLARTPSLPPDVSSALPAASAWPARAPGAPPHPARSHRAPFAGEAESEREGRQTLSLSGAHVLALGATVPIARSGAAGDAPRPLRAPPDGERRGRQTSSSSGALMFASGWAPPCGPPPCVPPSSAMGDATSGTGSDAALEAAWSRTWISAGQAVPVASPQPRNRAMQLSMAAVLLGVLALLLVEAGTRWQHSAARQRSEHLLRVTALDVGQGDATLVDLPDGRLMLIDGGGNVGVPVDPGERVILPVLRARRRDRLDILVLTHPHPDHLGGLLSVARELPIGELWYGGAPAPGGSDYQRLLDLLARHHVPLRDAAELCTPPGTGAAADRIPSVQILHPCPLDPAHSLNDNSLVLRITHGEHAALLMGDAELWAEQRLLTTYPTRLSADLLKVGHHGSRTSSSPAFLRAVHPRLATISSGVRNRFGHPHPETLTHLQAAGALPLRLDQLGSITWQTDGNTPHLQTWLTGNLPIEEASGPP